MTRHALVALALAAAPAGATAEPPQASLDLFNGMLGNCYTAAIGAGGVDTHCFAGVYGRAHVRDRHVVTINGKVVYQGETIYSRAADEIVFTYVNSIGGVGHGKAKGVPGGIDFTGSMRAGAETAPVPMDSTWRWQARGYVASDGKGPPVTFARVMRKTP